MTFQASPATTDHPVRARGGATTIILNIGVFFAAIALVCTLIHVPDPIADVPGIGPKFRFFAANKDNYNVLFLGSSRVFHHFLPKEFDAQVSRQTGVQVKSFNFGYDGMWPPESFYVLRKVLALRPPNLRWVLIDLVQINPKIDAENMGTKRVEYWHDLQHTLMAISALPRERGLSIWQKADLAATHVKLLATQFTNIGGATGWLDERLRLPNKKQPKPPKWAPAQGYEPGLDRTMEGDELHKFKKQIELFRAFPTAEISAEMREAIEAIAAEVRAIGAEPIFVLAPTLAREENITALPGNNVLFSFADSRRYPDLYDEANHYDAWHLNENGAQVFTTHLAARFCENLKAGVPSTEPPQTPK